MEVRFLVLAPKFKSSNPLKQKGTYFSSRDTSTKLDSEFSANISYQMWYLGRSSLEEVYKLVEKADIGTHLFCVICLVLRQRYAYHAM